MEELVAKLRLDYPNLLFRPGIMNCWSPQRSEILYMNNSEGSAAGVLHELAHAALNHQAFTSDLELLRKEIDAWEYAKELAVRYNVVVGEEYVQNCLDTYRDWIHKRSSCPRCASSGLQQSATVYTCINCLLKWQVTAERLCRPYRRFREKEKAEV